MQILHQPPQEEKAPQTDRFTRNHLCVISGKTHNKLQLMTFEMYLLRDGLSSEYLFTSCLNFIYISSVGSQKFFIYSTYTVWMTRLKRARTCCPKSECIDCCQQGHIRVVKDCRHWPVAQFFVQMLLLLGHINYHLHTLHSCQLLPYMLHMAWCWAHG